MRTEIYAFLLAALVAICATVLIALGDTVPPELWILGGVALGGGAGIALPSVTPGSSVTAQRMLTQTPEKPVNAEVSDTAVEVPVHAG